MRNLRTLFLVMWFSSACGATYGQLAPDPPSVMRGAVQKLTGSSAAIQSAAKSVVLHPMGVPSGAVPADIPISLRTNTASELTFIVAGPDNMNGGAVPFGSYEVFLKGEKGETLKEVTVQVPVEVKPGDIKLKSATAIDPYPDQSGKYSVRLLGDGFSSIPGENALLIDDARILFLCDDAKSGPPGCQPGLKIAPSGNGHQLEFSGIPNDLHGAHKVQVIVGGKSASDDDEREITLSLVSEWVPAVTAIGGYLLLVGFLYLLLRTGLRKIATAERLRSLLSLVFLDKESNSYSLSKLQFYLWTGAAVIAYIYLTAAKSLAQGNFEWGDIPSGLPGIILASAGTAIVSTGVASAKGSKGAGEMGPSLSDFITTGGVVAPERLQFLVWTLVGVSSFLMLVFLRSPISIHDLPPVPPGFLQIMGISSLGYVGGKLVRKAGPKISSIDASIDTQTGNLVLNVSGAILSQSGSFEIDGKQVSVSLILNDLDPHRPKPGAKDPTNSDPDLFQSLELTLQAPNNAWLTPSDEHNFTIYNPDGQKAVWPYKISCAKDLLAVAGAPGHVLVTAPGFALADNFEFENPSGTFNPLPGKVATGNSFVFDVQTGVAAGTALTIRITKPGVGGQSATSNQVVQP